MSQNWSPADLGRQRLLVRVIARRAEGDRVLLQHKRRRLMDEAMRTLSSPLGLTGCFLVGVVVGSWRSRAPRAVDAVDTAPAKHRVHPLRLLLGAWLWLRRGHAQVLDTKPPLVSDLDPPVALPPGEYVH